MIVVNGANKEEPRKRCTKCGRLLPLTEFYLSSKTHRPKPECQDCDRAYAKAYYARTRKKKRRPVAKKPKTKTPVKKPKKIDNTRCKTCAYRTYLKTGEVCCYYIIITGRMRGCEGGAKCTEYLKGKPLPLPPTNMAGFRFKDRRSC